MPTVKQILDLAESQVGTTEYPPNSNNVVYNTAFYGHEVSGDAYKWCCVYIWWLFAQFDPCIIPKTASCKTLAEWFKANGQWHASPQVGDIVFFKFGTTGNWTNHTGLVREVIDDGVKIGTNEGNTSEKGSQDNGGAVLNKIRSSNIVGYGRPLYDKEEKDSSDDSQYVQGIDISECQGVVDFAKVKADDISFVCIRSTKKNGLVDAYFERNLSECMSRAIDYSCYKYAYAKTHDEARIEANGVINLLKDRKMTIWYDLEDSSLVSLGKDGIEGIALSFIGECKEAGFDVGIYCNKNWYDNYISDYLKRKYKFWIARYGKNTGYLDEKYKPTGRNVIAWQYTSKGKVDGIEGVVDRDVLY